MLYLVITHMSKPVKATDIDLNQIIFGKLEDSPFVKSQKIAHIHYGNEGVSLSIQSPEILTETYGIPRVSEYYTTIQSRSFYKLPFCFERNQHCNEVNYPLIKQFHDKLLEIDKYCDSEEFKSQVFGSNAGKYEYQPIVRQPSEEEGNSSYYRPPYIKVKLVLDQVSSKPYFSVFNVQDGKRELTEVNDFEDLLKHMRFMTKHRFILRFSKLYAMKTASGNTKKKYGIVLKLVSVECSNKNNKGQMDKNADVFLDD